MGPLQGDYNKAIFSNTNYKMEVSTMYLSFRDHQERKGKRMERKKGDK